MTDAIARDDWHEDDGDVLWWAFPVREPPYVGTPLDDDFPAYVTHWTRLGPPPNAPEPSPEPCEACGMVHDLQYGDESVAECNSNLVDQLAAERVRSRRLRKLADGYRALADRVETWGVLRFHDGKAKGAKEERARIVAYLRSELAGYDESETEHVTLRGVVGELEHEQAEGPYVCPGCHAVAPERCAPGCIDAEIEEAHREAIERGDHDEDEEESA